MIRHDVDHQRHSMLLQHLHQRVEILLGTDIRIERIVVDDVVAMRTAGTRLQKRRCVQMADAESCEIRHDRPRCAKVEISVELDSIRGAWNHGAAPESATTRQTTDHAGNSTAVGSTSKVAYRIASDGCCVQGAGRFPKFASSCNARPSS